MRRGVHLRCAKGKSWDAQIVSGGFLWHKTVYSVATGKICPITLVMRLYYAIIGSYVPVAAENDAYIYRVPPSASFFSRALHLDGYPTARVSIERL